MSIRFIPTWKFNHYEKTNDPFNLIKEIVDEIYFKIKDLEEKIKKIQEEK